MSSGSSSPFPSLTKQAESSSGALSNDALYAPLSTYDGTSTSSNSSKNDKKRHSLTLQTSQSLRESSLLTFLSNTCQNLKTSHPYEYAFYRSIGGSLTKHGMGDNDNANEITKSFFESKLSNRSLVLVGGGVHSHASRNEEGAAVSIVQTAAVGKKRERKRVGGNGMFGSLSGRKRKKILRQALNRDSESCVVEPTDEDKQVVVVDSSTSSQSEENIKKILQSLHKMWLDYTSQLLLHIKPEAPIPTPKKGNPSQNKSSTLDLTTSPHLRRQLASLILDAEHVGMAATIIECPSRRNLIHHRCVVVNETKNTWTVAMLLCKKKKKMKQADNALPENETDVEMHKAKRLWEVVMIPKHGTVLEVTIPLQQDSDGKCGLAASSVSVRLES